MTTESSPGQGAPQEDQDWAFRPRRSPADRPPYREQRPPEPTAPWGARPTEPTTPWDNRPTEPTAQWDNRPGPTTQWNNHSGPTTQWDDHSEPTTSWNNQPEPTTPWDDRPTAEPYAGSPGTRWDTTGPSRASEPRADAYGAAPEPGRRTPPHAWHGGEPADPQSGYPSAQTSVPDRTAARRPDPAAAQPQPQPSAGADGERTARKSGKLGRIALALVLLAAGGAAAVLFKQEDAVAVASKNLTRTWQIPAPAADDALIGSWLTDKLLVRAGTRSGLRAYDLTDGRQVWSTPSSATSAKRGTVPCAMSPTLGAKGIGTVAFGTDGSTCTRLAGVDASTGKILWSIPLTSAKHPTAATVATYLQGNVATVVGQNVLGGVNLRTGSRVWGYKARGHYCNAYNWGADGTVLVDDFCLDRKTRSTLTAYDGRTGKVIWRKSEKAHSDVTHILSGSPLVAAVHTARQDAVRVFGTTGTGRKLAVGNDELTTGNSTGADHSARLYGNVLVTPATAAGGTAIDGFDTTTGRKLWTYRSAALAVPASGTDGKVYAVTTSGPPQLITIDPRTGRTTPVAGLPAGTGKWSFTAGTVYVTSDGGVLELNALGSNGGVRLYE
ncbi:PQQ-binding-like beta-propeller repeat protein [Streptomyces sp. NPDC021080]|uniref:outer membrane protein assembly factor BamB family protein n=1 Tax=Streptomyces sp. NPDC021080 TaxID=3365110 RepID=UPI003796D9D5